MSDHIPLEEGGDGGGDQPQQPQQQQRRSWRRRLNAPRVTIRITREVIENSVQRTSAHCMISEAIRAQVPGSKNVSTDLNTIRWTDPQAGLRYVYLTPRNAQLALIYFDAGVTPEPFDIVLIRASQIGQARRAGRTPDANGERRQRPAATATSPFNADGSARVQPDGTAVGTVIGGRMPPIGNLAKVRRFGLRQFIV